MWSLIYCALKSEYRKAAVLNCVKLERARVGIERADNLRSSWECLWDAVSLCHRLKGKSPVPGCFCTVPSCPIDPWSCRSSQAHLLQVDGSIYSLMEALLQASRYPGWKQYKVCLGQCCRGLDCTLAVGTPQPPYSGLIFITISSFLLLLKSFFAVRSAWETIVFSFITKSLCSHS